MNYVLHLESFFERAKGDKTLTPFHVSLYLALFHEWNYNRFSNHFAAFRDDLMKISKIGSKNTYHRCIKDLHQAGYIQYYPSQGKYAPMGIGIIRLDIEDAKKTYQQQKMLCPKCGTRKGSDTCTTFDTKRVPHLTDTCPKNDTKQVSKMGHLTKHIKL